MGTGSLIRTDHIRSSWQPKIGFKGKRDRSLKIRRESLLPATGRSMTEGGGPSAAEVATSLPARLLGAIEELQKFSKFSE